MKKKKGKKPLRKKHQCRLCYYWVIDESWDKLKAVKDPRVMGYCYFKPPELMQTLVPFAIREHGLNNLKNSIDKFQLRPITEAIDFCQEFIKR